MTPDDDNSFTSSIDEEVDATAGQEIPLDSSWLRACKYDKRTQTLDVRTISGRSYTLQSVPPDVFTAFISSSSPGNYFNDNLKGKY